MRTNDLHKLLVDAPAFVAVAEHGSFAAAARHLGLTPSVLSRRVSRLERRLAVRLLERSTRALRLTECGAETLERFRRMLVLAGEVAGLAEATAGVPRGTVRLGAPRALGRHVVHPLLPGFLERFAEVRLQLVLSDRALDPVVDDLDLVLSITERPDSELVARRLMAVEQVLVASPAYLDARGAPGEPDELAGHRCLYLAETRDDSLWRLRRGDDACAVRVDGPYGVNSAAMRLDLAARHLGIARVPDFTARAALDAGALVQVLPGWLLDGPYRGHVHLQYSRTRYVPLGARRLIEHLSEALAAGPPDAFPEPFADALPDAWARGYRT